ncbi:hypothetical protein F8B91_07775 [Aestuariivirga litoralis]|nr:hypothetical protein [Aestuariivirga litoralis]
MKAILPAAKISYGADWSEYFGHQPSDGSGDVIFHLDPFWADSHVDFIGIDNYFPLTDWRDGADHLDRASGASSIYDQGYLTSRIAGGEGFDWYYASDADRDAQARTPITDGAYGKPWIFRPKDVRSWWLNAHHDRPGGIESAAATAWVPQSKPFWFTELGCPAVDKGTNQPNVFVDAKSSESALPFYSDGKQDAELQLAYIQAMQTYWANNNPVSSVTGAPMVDVGRMFHWCWDARPFPAFPARSDVWADAPNYARGHWLNGRLGAVSLASLITDLAVRYGLDDVDVTEAHGLVDGFVLDKPMSAREALEGLLQAFCIDALEAEGKMKFVSRRINAPLEISVDDLVDDDKASPLLMQYRAQEADLPLAVHVGFSESGLDYRQSAVSQRTIGSTSKAEVVISVPAAMTQKSAQGLADVALAEAHAARETAQFVLPPSFEAVEPGDVLALAGNLWRVKSVTAGTALKIEALAYDAAAYDPPPAPDRGVTFDLPPVYGAADALLMDLALVSDDGSVAPRLAAQATPWPGSLVLYRQTSDASLKFNRLVTQQASLGVTLTALPTGRTARVDFTTTLDVEMSSGTLSSISAEALYGGGNAAALGTPETGFEILQFRDALLIAPRTYRLAGLLRAQAGSGPEMLTLRAAGQNVVLLNAAVVQPVASSSESGLPSVWRLGPQQRDPGDPSYVELESAGTLKALRPLSPVSLALKKVAGGFSISWIRRTREQGDSWEFAEVPLGEVSESYRLDIMNGTSVLRSVKLSAPEYFYASADAIADFGSLPASLKLRVAQISASVGAGAILEGTLNV